MYTDMYDCVTCDSSIQEEGGNYECQNCLPVSPPVTTQFDWPVAGRQSQYQIFPDLSFPPSSHSQ